MVVSHTFSLISFKIISIPQFVQDNSSLNLHCSWQSSDWSEFHLYQARFYSDSASNVSNKMLI